MNGLGGHAVVNGALVDASQAVMHVQDREVQYGFGVYESLRILSGKVVYLEDHLERLFYSAAGIGLRNPFTSLQISSWLSLLLDTDGIEEATVRILLMGGAEASLFITAFPMLTYPDGFYTEGVGAIGYRGERFLPQYKTCSLLMNYLALREANEHGAFEALLIDRQGRVLEGTRSNIFACEGDTIHTAASDLVLAGVTRDKILTAVGELGYALSWEAPTLADVLDGRYGELFISSTSMGAMPISSLDGVRFPGPFPVAAAIHSLIRQWEVNALH